MNLLLTEKSMVFQEKKIQIEMLILMEPSFNLKCLWRIDLPVVITSMNNLIL